MGNERNKVMVMVIKEVEVDAQYEPLTDAEKRAAFMLDQYGSGAFWDEAIFRWGIAPSVEEIVKLIESTYSFDPEDYVDIGTSDLARNILKLFGCGDLRPAGSAQTIGEVAAERPYLALETDSPERWSEFATQHPGYKEAGA